MKKILLLMQFVEIQKSFLIIGILFIALGYAEHFFILLLCVTAHELSHVITALLFGCKLKRVIFTALGETAVIEGVDGMGLGKKLIILLAGPAMNIVIGLCAAVCTGRVGLLASINFSLAVFNLLPLYPLDGGRVLHSVLGEAIGVINAYKFVLKTGKLICRVFILLGLIQVVLYPYNISIICIGVYIIKSNEKQYLHNVFDFYKFKMSMVNRSQKLDDLKIIRSTRLVVSPDLPLSNLVSRLSFNRFYFFAITVGNNITFEFDELQMIKYISVNGTNKTVRELQGDILCK